MAITVEDRTKHKYWENLKVDDIVRLSDKQAIEYSMKQGWGPDGVAYTVKNMKELDDLDSGVKVIYAEIEDQNEDVLYLFTKLVSGTDSDVRIYWMPNGPTGTRKDLIDSETVFMFQQPENEEDFDVRDLAYTTQIPYYDNDNNEIIYKLKGMGEQHYKCQETPAISDDDLIATLVEYITDEETDNPEMLLLEIGTTESEYGGVIELLLGASVDYNDIELLKK